MIGIVQKIFSDAVMIGFFVANLLHTGFNYFVDHCPWDTHQDWRMGGHNKLAVFIF